MRFLDDLKISVKILSVIGLLSAVTALSLHSLDATSSQIVGKDDPAILAVARAARSANIIGYAAHRALAYPGASTEARTSARSVESNNNNAMKYVAEAEQLKPAAASAEQATGLERINKALTRTDEVTQQNSALVEENVATAKTLENLPAVKPAAKPVAKAAATTTAKRAAKPAATTGGGPVGRMRSALAAAIKNPEWDEF
jgi:hypothetical protein